MQSRKLAFKRTVLGGYNTGFTRKPSTFSSSSERISAYFDWIICIFKSLSVRKKAASGVSFSMDMVSNHRLTVIGDKL